MKTKTIQYQVPEMTNPFESPEEVTEPFIRPEEPRRRYRKPSLFKAFARFFVGMLTPAPVCCALMGLFAGPHPLEGMLSGLFLGLFFGNIIMVLHNITYSAIMTFVMCSTRHHSARILIHFGTSIVLGAIVAATLNIGIYFIALGSATGLIAGFFLWLMRPLTNEQLLIND